jgi:hypothetical protein
MRLVLLGPPGSGKRTQAQRLRSSFGMPLLSTGDMLRTVAAQSPIGRAAKAVMARGELVSDAIVIGIVADRLDQEDVRSGFALDPFVAWPLGFRRYLVPVLDRNPYLNAVRSVELCAGSELLSAVGQLLFDPAAREQLRLHQAEYAESVRQLPSPSQLVPEILGRC